MSYYVTFYSYKGGVGRTLTLVNVAVSLAQQGHSVFIWELDLEAPGILEIPFFERLPQVQGGVADLLATALDQDPLDRLPQFVLEHPEFGDRLRVLPAGTRGEDYRKTYSAIPWDRFFGKGLTAGSKIFERMRQAVDSYNAEFVLIDSRTGLTDMGGICTVQLPDTVVIVYNLSRQNAAGAAGVQIALTRGKERIRPLNILRVACPVPTDHPEFAKERLAVLPPHVQIPLNTRLLLEETVWVHEFPDDLTLTPAYRDLAKRLIDAASVVSLSGSATGRASVEGRLSVVERGKRFEEKVADVLRLMGFEVTANVQIEGRQVDLVARKKEALQETVFLVECKAREKAAGPEDIDQLHTRVQGSGDPIARGLFVSSSGFTAHAHPRAEKFGILLKSYDQLLTDLVDLGNYPTMLVQDVEGKDIERLYIEQTVFPEATGEKTALWSFVDRWLEGTDGLQLTVLGDYGTGKTWFTRMLAARLARRYKEDPVNRPQPIRIDLRQAAKALSLENLLFEHFQRETGRLVNPKSILYLLAEGRFVLIFDGFDEMATQSNWDVTLSNFRDLARAAEGRAKVILTCRTHYFEDAAQVREMVEGRRGELTTEGTQLYKEIFGRRGFSLAYLLDFGAEQIDAYIGRACGERAGEVRNVIGRIPRLQEIAGRPVLLDMIVKSAPQLARLGGDITVANLYEAYTEEWLTRQDWRLRITRDIRGKLIEELAARLWETDGARVHYNELMSILRELLGDKIVTVDDLAAADTEVRTASFLTRDNDGYYSFSHRSFLEFFLARRILRVLDLRLRLLSPEVRGFLRELDREQRFERAVSEVLTQKYVKLASENALMLLGQTALPAPAQLEGAELAGFQLAVMKLAGANLRKANLAGANLSRAECEGADFRGADLTGADLTGARCMGADFTGANLDFATLLGTGLDGRGHFGAAVDGARPESAMVQTGAPSLVTSVAFHPEGKLVAAGSGDGTIRIYDVPTGRLRRVLAGHCVGVNSVAWSPDGAHLASGSYDKTLQVWDAATGRALKTLEGHEGLVRSVAWSPDGEHLASGSDDRTLRVWEAASGRALKTLEGHEGLVRSVAWSPDGAKLASGSSDKTLRVWEAASGRALKTLEGHGGLVMSVAWSPDGAHLASGSYDKTLRVWDAVSGLALKTLEGHTHWVMSVAWSPDGAYLASGSDDNTLRVWEVASGRALKTLEGQTSLVLSVAWSPDGSKLASGSGDNAIRVWEATSGRALKTLEGHTATVWSVAWSPDRAQLASGSEDNTIRIWEAASGRALKTLEGHKNWVRSVAWSPDGSKLASGSGDNTIRVWEAASGRALKTLEGHTATVWSVAWSPDGAKLVSGSNDRTLRVWEAASGREIKTLEGHTANVLSVAWSPDGAKLASGSADDTLRVWEAASGRALKTLEGHTNAVWSVAWSPDGARLVSGSVDHTLRVWEAASGRALKTLEGYLGPVPSVAWHGQNRVASTSVDGSIRIWDAESGRCLLTLWHLPGNGWLAIHPDLRFTGNEQGKRYLTFSSGWALYPPSAFPELEIA